MSVNGGDGWRPACNSDAFRIVWVEGIRLGGWMVSSDVGGRCVVSPGLSACRSSVLGGVPAQRVSPGDFCD